MTLFYSLPPYLLLPVQCTSLLRHAAELNIAGNLSRYHVLQRTLASVPYLVIALAAELNTAGNFSRYLIHPDIGLLPRYRSLTSYVGRR